MCVKYAVGTVLHKKSKAVDFCYGPTLEHIRC